MPSLLSSILATIGYWVRLGLSLFEAQQRAELQYGPASAPQISEAVNLFQQSQQAAINIVQTPGGFPVQASALPCVPGQVSPFQYGAVVHQIDVNTLTPADVYVVITSTTPLSAREIQDLAISSSIKTVELSPEKFIQPGKLPFKPLQPSQTPVSIMTATCGSVVGPINP